MQIDEGNSVQKAGDSDPLNTSSIEKHGEENKINEMDMSRDDSMRRSLSMISPSKS
jgi:hypothetical protein